VMMHLLMALTKNLYIVSNVSTSMDTTSVFSLVQAPKGIRRPCREGKQQ